MTRRYRGNMNGEQYLANTSTSKREVHDLDQEKANCQIDEIIRAGHDKPYRSLYEARRDGFDNWAYSWRFDSLIASTAFGNPAVLTHF